MEARSWDPSLRTRGGSFLHPALPQQASALLLCKLEGCWGGLPSRLKPFCFCIEGREASFFFSFWVIFTLPKSEKCPNQIGGQVATGNHSTKPVLFFFFPFLSETPCRRKVNGMSVGCSTFRVPDAFKTRRTKQKITLRPKPRSRK